RRGPGTCFLGSDHNGDPILVHLGLEIVSKLGEVGCVPGYLGRLAEVLKEALAQSIQGLGRLRILGLDHELETWLGIRAQTGCGPEQTTSDTGDRAAAQLL